MYTYVMYLYVLGEIMGWECDKPGVIPKGLLSLHPNLGPCKMTPNVKLKISSKTEFCLGYLGFGGKDWNGETQ